MRLYIAQAYHDRATCSVYLEGTISQRRACIDFRMLSTTVASPCRTVCEVLAGDEY